jgi:hypothetical protein
MLMADIMAAEMQREMGVTQGTKDKERRAWNRWCKDTKCIGFQDDVWLTKLTPEYRTTIFGAFAAALRRRQFSRPDTTDLASGTVQETLAKLGEVFRANVGYNPTHAPGSETLHPALSRQFKGMKNLDPGEKQQRALPVCVYREFHKIAYSSQSFSLDLDRALAQLLNLAFFFCMRSCEYSDVQGERRTKLLCVRNLRFFTADNKDITEHNSYLHLAETVTITFEFQKRDIRNDIISHQRSKDKLGNGEMCPVRSAAGLVQRLYAYSNSPYTSFHDTPINLVWSGGDYYTIPSSLVLQRIRTVVDLLGFEKLGFTSSDVGTHSNRSGGAMGMFLAGTPVYTIMLMGRWSSDAFMRYIRKQVLQLSHGISSKMLTFEEFYTAPDFMNSHADGGLNLREGITLASSSNSSGTHANMSRGLHPAFHLNH